MLYKISRYGRPSPFRIPKQNDLDGFTDYFINTRVEGKQLVTGPVARLPLSGHSFNDQSNLTTPPPPSLPNYIYSSLPYRLSNPHRQSDDPGHDRYGA